MVASFFAVLCRGNVGSLMVPCRHQKALCAAASALVLFHHLRQAIS